MEVQFLNREQVDSLIDIVINNEILPILSEDLLKDENKDKLEAILGQLSINAVAPLLLTNAVDTYENLYNYTKSLMDINKYLS